MATVQKEQSTAAWRILLLAKNGLELLALRRPAGFCLPVLQISPHRRIAESLNAEAQRLWHVETICIVPFDVPHPDGTSGLARYHVMEVRKSEDLIRIAPRGVDIDTLAKDAFSDVRDFLAVRRAMKLDAANSSQVTSGSFSECGSFHEISTWVERQLQPVGRKWDGSFRQLHASDSFALLRFQTKDGAAWFKATGEPNRKEFPITRTLASMFPRHIPAIIAARAEWNAWLMEEVPGADLDSGRDLRPWCRAAEALAELQVTSIGKTASIAASGSHDAGVTRLLSQVIPFFAEIERLMEAQIKTTPRPLYTQEIRDLEFQMIDALNELQAMRIPDSLNHFDLNPGNTIVHSEACWFLDWAEAAVGNPFFSFEYLRQHFLHAFGEDTGFAPEFRSSYTNVWRTVLPDETVDRALELMPLVAPFAFAVASLPWNDPLRNADPESAAFLRSLARRMYREAEQRTGHTAQTS
jgi:hypothetical protein